MKERYSAGADSREMLHAHYEERAASERDAIASREIQEALYRAEREVLESFLDSDTLRFDLIKKFPEVIPFLLRSERIGERSLRLLFSYLPHASRSLSGLDLTNERRKEIIDVLSDVYLYSFDQKNEEQVRSWHKNNRTALLGLLSGFDNEEEKDFALLKIISHATDQDFGDPELTKNLISQIEDPWVKSKAEFELTHHRQEGDQKYAAFLDGLSRISKKNAASFLQYQDIVKTRDSLNNERRRSVIYGSFATLEEILRDKRLKSIYEVNNVSENYNYLARRHDIELEMGIRSKGTKDDPHPVYAMLRYGENLKNPFQETIQQGGIYFELKEDRIKKRSAFTLGDSLSASSFQNKGISDRQFCYEDAPVAYAAIQCGEPGEYVEIQVLGGVILDDIESINIDEEVYQALAPHDQKKWDLFAQTYPTIQFHRKGGKKFVLPKKAL